ncbi:MAG: hypothetical protein C7B46_02465 [Sulfobacillus benefaciens]|uniref:Uncharacterized protein n=1 Tax=Sulfobacillus benefaciens TaxID=453960 RepID=A0A2T2XKM2_9FIRM|nr:MAG: hypothetical protein C7B46_02465 [Sulfobacillus benefaciens]
MIFASNEQVMPKGGAVVPVEPQTVNPRLITWLILHAALAIFWYYCCRKVRYLRISRNLLGNRGVVVIVLGMKEGDLI